MKKILTVLLVTVALLGTVLPLEALAYAGSNSDYEWSLDHDTGALTVKFKTVFDFSSGSTAGYTVKINDDYVGPMVLYVYVKEGTTHIPAYAFTIGIPKYEGGSHVKQDCYNMREIYIPSTVTSVGDYAIHSHTNKIVVYGDSISFGAGVPKTATIYGYAGTDAEMFAHSNGNTFVAMCREHTESLVDQKDPTCTEKGYTGDKVCSVCGVVLEYGVEIKELGHDYQLTGKTDSDCENTGYSGDMVCSRCSDVESYGETISALGHAWSEWSVITNPTCTNTGVKMRFCSRCSEQETDVINPIGHLFVEIVAYEKLAVEVTCTEASRYYKTCSICGDLSEETFAAGEALGHDYQEKPDTAYLVSEADCTNPAVYYKSCSRCGEATEETFTYGNPKGHSFGDWIITKEATEEEAGEKERVCSVCQEKETREIPKIEVINNPFTDVPEKSWFTAGVLYCYKNGLMSGTSTTTFSPNMPFTRAMFVTVLAKIDGADTSEYTGTSFDDVSEGRWYSKAIEWAVQNGYTTGTGNNCFSPDAPITRETLAQFLYNYTQKKGEDVSAGDNLAKYTDGGDISGWAKNAVNWAVEKGLISGTTEITISPKTTATRAQVTLIIMKYVENVK